MLFLPIAAQGSAQSQPQSQFTLFLRSAAQGSAQLQPQPQSTIFLRSAAQGSAQSQPQVRVNRFSLMNRSSGPKAYQQKPL